MTTISKRRPLTPKQRKQVADVNKRKRLATQVVVRLTDEDLVRCHYEAKKAKMSLADLIRSRLGLQTTGKKGGTKDTVIGRKTW